jgi:dTDP-4-dehydrorhamnose reductase
MDRIVLTGVGGLLGGAFREALADHSVLSVGRDKLDPDSPDAFVRLVRDFAPELVINCAAHTDVEAAERDPAKDFKANAQLPGLIGEICKRHDAMLVHFSSTGCYGDWKSTPFCEDDEVRSTTSHHRAKVAGEQAIRESGCRHLIVRTGWLYGGSPEQPKNFIWKRLVEASSADVITSDASQRGCPTYVVDLTRQTLLMIERSLEGIFNVTAHGNATRYEYVGAIIAAAGLRCLVKPGLGFTRSARVSPNETAVNRRLQALGLDRMPEWGVSLRTYLPLLLTSPAWALLAQGQQTELAP